ncbi:MAG: caspase family protein [Legionella sp.]
MRKALIVGINYYTNIAPLHGCVNDAYSIKNALERNSDGTLNFGIKILNGTEPTEIISRIILKDQIRELFAGDADIALFYFAGHAHLDANGGYLLPSDCETGDDGIPLNEVLNMANTSKARNKIIILDCCHSGIAGASTTTPISELAEGITILSASTAEQYATEKDGSGIFTTLFVDALNGSAGNLVGDVTPGSIYAHIDQSLGPWEQRPVFKTNVQNFVSLKKVQSAIDLSDLRLITTLFPIPGHEFQLDPSFEPTSPNQIPENVQKFTILQKYNRVNLVVPVYSSHMYYAAMESKSCKLTVLGEHYQKLVQRGRI